MATQIASIATILLAGIGISLTIGACILSSLPIWIAVPVVIAIAIVGICGS